MRQEALLCCCINTQVEMIVRVDYLTTLSQTVLRLFVAINLKRCKKEIPLAYIYYNQHYAHDWSG